MGRVITAKNHLITGGTGFIGSHLAETLRTMGLSVTVFDNLSNSSESICLDLKARGVRVVIGDLLDQRALDEVIINQDVVWHLGANTNMVVGGSSPAVDFDNGTVATYRVLEAMRRYEVSELIFPSSGAVYGHIERPPASENYGPLLPLSMYGAAKLAAEGLISAYCELFDLQASIFRFGNVIGSRMSHGVIYDFIGKLRNNPSQLEILGDGKGKKNYFLVEECINGMIFGYTHRALSCETFNLGTQSTTNVLDIADIVVEEMGLRNVEYVFTGGVQGWRGDQPVVLMDVTKMLDLGWKAKHTSSEAVRLATQRYLGDRV